jgi:hypothetical protein
MPSCIWLTIFHFGLGDRRRAVARATDEAGDLAGVLDQVPGVVGHLHLDQHVAREDAALGDGLLAVLEFDHLFGGHQDAAELVLHAGAVDALAQVAFDGLLHAGVGVHDVPARLFDVGAIAMSAMVVD